ncbi:hypothetical protein SIM22_04315 [Bacillus cereus group sp. BfR-BA-01363]|uniref:hypothetical protein n=1 Tax=Bacillus cereus group sp. BfR-BA-01363 TaxID=3094882 RepID=UPI0029C4D487|nr:hypothetical protein [Bacillus cereus group sp. BfR-BA-01363]MDX5853353.1 hypothetical protein [Bacillus cereus group sp. BfR-BA-01363]
MLNLYFLLKISTLVFFILVFVFMYRVLFVENSWSLILVVISALCFALSGGALMSEITQNERRVLVDSLQLKNADEIESIEPIGRNKALYEIKTKEGSYHVTFKEGDIVKVEKLEVKELSSNRIKNKAL